MPNLQTIIALVVSSSGGREVKHSNLLEGKVFVSMLLFYTRYVPLLISYARMLKTDTNELTI